MLSQGQILIYAFFFFYNLITYSIFCILNRFRHTRSNFWVLYNLRDLSKFEH